MNDNNNYSNEGSVWRGRKREMDQNAGLSIDRTNNNSKNRKSKSKKNRALHGIRNKTTKRYDLVTFEELPEYMKDNEYILNYYRSDWPLKEALFSIFRWHNETLNVWTHLIGFALFLGLTVANLMHVSQVAEFFGIFTRSWTYLDRNGRTKEALLGLVSRHSTADSRLISGLYPEKLGSLWLVLPQKVPPKWVHLLWSVPKTTPAEVCTRQWHLLSFAQKRGKRVYQSLVVQEMEYFIRPLRHMSSPYLATWPREIEEVPRANKVVEVKLLQWEHIQDKVLASSGRKRSSNSSGPSPNIVKVGEGRKIVNYL
ncbi:hypothetical protein TEA_020424 [Camellia sinensis var. sinensis]|uniref:Uncharacterized protein n=1 Tax=Camellia sinensis var. sinensis TaxID=542762 RepID=A0A4S4CZ70_CAMSN|nr:hypothetical protein TEA_020424 [Camellia sinensis var. sinensis]